MTAGDAHRSKMYFSLPRYLMSQIKKYEEQLAYFLAHDVDLEFYLKEKLSIKTTATQLQNQLHLAIIARKNYISYLQSPWLNKIKRFSSIKSFSSILRAEKNTIIILFSAAPIFGHVINSALYIFATSWSMMRHKKAK